MGSQLSGIAPAQILNAENYLIDIPDYIFEVSLGSTRFLKVARARHKEGLVVVKIFVIHDPSLPLQSYQDNLFNIEEKLHSCPNVLPFSKSLLAERAGLLVRPFLHDNLYDRISTRPFLKTVEKKWVVFQLLSALEQMHSMKICHGDIKTENILLTSWNWVLLTDIASFKPVYLPVDNPADFNYFFDTSRRRTCNIAPERFIDSSSNVTDNSTSGEQKKGNLSATYLLPMEGFPGTNHLKLQESMDIFSAGCVIAELFCDGSALFDLSQLLAYRTLDFNIDSKIGKVDDNIKDMIQHMVQVDPSKRLSAKEYMSRYRGTVFPEEFYSFLKSYLSAFAAQPIMTPDEKIARLSKDMPVICESLFHKGQLEDGNINERKFFPEDDNCFIAILSLVTTCVRSLKLTWSKLTSLSLMVELARFLPDEIILEQILPYMFFYMHDPIPRVKGHMIKKITECIQLINTLPRNEANIFPEYILPNLSQIANDSEVIVQCAFAENISALAETALRFLELSQVDSFSSNEQTQYQTSYDVELHALHELIQSKVVSLLSDSDNIVKRTLLENGLTSLCVFFGRQKANDILLSHIITFLNDKEDWQLRAAFFDSIVGIASYIGWHCLPILKPLLQQGLKDSEEFVITRALIAVTSLVELSLLQKSIIQEFSKDIIPFLFHPNRWIRYSCIGFIVACAKSMSLVDVHCRLVPMVLPYLKEQVLQLYDQSLLISLLEEEVPRSIYDYIVKSAYASQLLSWLEELHKDNSQGSFNLDLSDSLTQVIRKLRSQGMNSVMEKKLLFLKDTILRSSFSKSSIDSQESQDHFLPGILDLSLCGETKVFTLNLASDDQVDSKTNNSSKMQPLNSNLQTSSEEDSEKKNVSESSQISTTKSNDTPIAALKIQPKLAECNKDMFLLTSYMREQYIHDTKKRNILHKVIENRSRQIGWKSKGQLVAHLHEHKAAINRIVVNSDHSFFATASEDSTVKIWDTQRLDGKALTTRSKFTYTKQVGNINCLAFCQNSTLACSSDDASIHVFKIDASAPQPHKLALIIERKLNMQEEGCAVDLHHFDSGTESIITYATVYGYIVGWDLRQPKEKYAWKFKNNSLLGLINSFAVDPLQCWLTCGTSDGALTCWDLRFQLPITEIVHPKKACVRRVSYHPLETSWVVASFHGNNEVSMWDLETSAKKKTLWASFNPPLTYSQQTNDSVLTMFSSHNEGKTFFITAGSDKRLRYWDLMNPENSSIISGSATDNLDHIALQYNNRLIDGTEVLYETYEKKRSNTFDEHPRKNLGESPTGHLDCITDIAMTKLPQNFLLSCSKDGVVKVWK